jgi:hypothetical protein
MAKHDTITREEVEEILAATDWNAYWAEVDRAAEEEIERMVAALWERK